MQTNIVVQRIIIKKRDSRRNDVCPSLLVIIDRIAIFYIYDLDCNSSKASANTLFHIDVASGN